MGHYCYPESIKSPLQPAGKDKDLISHPIGRVDLLDRILRSSEVRDGVDLQGYNN